MVQENTYPIGVTGQKWGAAEKVLWLTKQTIKRSYQAEVAARIAPLAEHFQVDQYGALSYNPSEYPLFVVKSTQWSEDKPTVLVTGGVHGYETSGVQGAIRFLETKAKAYEDRFNILVAPCVSPWGYETINRWNPNAVDPNRSFYRDSPAEESAALMAYIADLGIDITVHIDLHETTNTDNSAFRPALAARDAVEHTNWNIPDGFYLVGNTELPAEAFQTAIIESVEKVTHIAPADDAGKLIGVALSQFGVINYATKALGLCVGFSDSIYATTTEVYPDSPKVDDENCVLAQVSAITGGLDYILPLS
ncbi:M14 family metallocarboxypeptidase [Shewanella sp. YLB-07]|uniref:M14 family metallopeptidase n=1 Tax=Shewanella sp. YLB-07 TaxID=2601268 RepID=UPI00128C141F|nr:M14 family metallocarboxypeptidase [Shewanella sp. YLB-07]MPY21568.1 M14 family metallocarboxypeptidase [Shewanella sp. YLB-07]